MPSKWSQIQQFGFLITLAPGNQVNMGAGKSLLSNEEMEDYLQLTYLNMAEIKKIEKLFISMSRNQSRLDFDERIPADIIIESLPQFKVNPFRDRLALIFSSRQDNCFSFEDMLDLFSALSGNCPTRVKALWVFKILVSSTDKCSCVAPGYSPHLMKGTRIPETLCDFDSDSSLNMDDLVRLINRLLGPEHRVVRLLEYAEVETVAASLLEEVDIAKTGGIAPMEFVHAAIKMPDFSHSFTITL